MVFIFLRLYWGDVIAPKVCLKHLDTSRIALAFTRVIIKESINQDVGGNTDVSQYEVISIESLGKTRIVTGNYNQM